MMMKHVKAADETQAQAMHAPLFPKNDQLAKQGAVVEELCVCGTKDQISSASTRLRRALPGCHTDHTHR